VEVFEDASVLGSTCSYNRPGSFTPANTEPATCALSYSPVQNDMTDFLFSRIVGRLNAFNFQKQKIAIAASSNKSIPDIQCFPIAGWSYNSVRKGLGLY